MKTKLYSSVIALALLAGIHTVAAQGTAFTYQGQLDSAGGPANGTYDVTYKLWNALSGGAQVGTTQTKTGTVISNGLFTATLDFGSQFNGTSYWLELAVRTNGAASYTTLTPRQQLTPAPYAITAENVDGLVPASQLSGPIPPTALAGAYPNPVALTSPGNTVDGNGAGLTGVNALQLDGLTAANFWQLNGNAGTTPGLNYLGTPDNQALEIHVNGSRALRIETGSGFYDPVDPNIIGGSAGNYVASGGVLNVIAGGGDYYESSTNSISGNLNVIGGGWNNTITNFANGATVGGGENNTASSIESTVGGGDENSATGNYSTVPGGIENLASGVASFAAGEDAQATNDGTFVWADSQGSTFSSTTNNEFSIRALNGVRIQSDVGIHLNAADRPLVVRDWDVFGPTAPTYKAGIGRWGLFMENSTLSLGIPGDDVSPRWFQVAKYNLDGSFVTLMQLDQGGDIRNIGLVNSGSQTGTTQAPNEPGLVVRRINSTTTTAGSIVARTATLTLVRDGSNGGWRVNYVASPGDVTIAATGITSAGAVVGFYTSLGNPSTAGFVQVFTDAQAVHSIQISFGDPFDEAHLTQVNMTRYTSDYFWIGTVNSTFNQ